MKRIEKMLPKAIEAVTQFIADNGKVDKAFSGYISSFGASITTAGLLPTLIFFSDKGSSQADRPGIIKSINFILQEYGYLLPDQQLLEVVKNHILPLNSSQLARYEKLILDAAVALKLALRTFQKK